MDLGLTPLITGSSNFIFKGLIIMAIDLPKRLLSVKCKQLFSS
ncbi:hypothetical protein SDC9_200195 [bioreactor metagenome]|uniref:Uncharacterized protein n=1 Tax=bioreactor metagenome TaxID=1076179 RepID=A0A645IZA3_9ZZZZ